MKRTVGKTDHFCAHCGLDMVSEDEKPVCPALDDGIHCKPIRRALRARFHRRMIARARRGAALQ